MSKENYKYPPIALLNAHTEDINVKLDNLKDQVEVCNFLNEFILQKGFNYQLTGVTYGYNITDYRFSPREELGSISDAVKGTNYLLVSKFCIDFIRAIHSKLPARTSRVDYVIGKQKFKTDFVVNVPNQRVRELPLSHRLANKEGDFNYIFAFDQFAQPLNYSASELCFCMVAYEEVSRLKNLLRCTLVGLSYKYTPDQLKIIMVGNEEVVGEFRDFPHHLFGEPLANLNYVYPILSFVQKEYENRKTLFEKTGCANFSEYQAKNGANPLARVLVVITNYAELQELYGVYKLKNNKLLTSLASLGEQFGFNFLIATTFDKKSTFSDLKDSLTLKIAFRFNSSMCSILAMASEDAHWLMSSNDAYSVASSKKRIIPCEITTKEFERVREFLKLNSNVLVNANDLKFLNDQMQNGEFSEQNRAKNLKNEQIKQIVRLAIKKGGVCAYEITTPLACDSTQCLNLLNECKEKKLLNNDKEIVRYQSNLTAKEFEKKFGEPL